ncbi:hypothetical protein NQ176_g3278 [Zarea fungicola]|uniref:Uncharacterized protein n=1 Tax=Zarea fungicola TaxID=93591 RepID=A0ACC1NK22_9HYPO|nr:hypothetical protein NQ176_g3278 [Lecanicillium fungicola]
MTFPDSAQYPKPPGQERPYPEPTTSGRLPFTMPGNGVQAETFYKLWGSLDGEKIPLLVLSGGPGATHEIMLTYALVHADLGVPVIMYDAVGCGQSTHFRDRVGDVEFFTPELELGGMLAAQWAATDKPAGLRKLILSDAPASMELWVQSIGKLRKTLPKDTLDVLEKYEKEDKVDAPEYEAAVMEFNRRHLCRLADWPKELTDTFAAMVDDNTVYLTMNGPNEMFISGSIRTWNIIDILPNLTPETVPGGILLMNGLFDEAQDEVVTPYLTQPSAKVKWVRFGLSSHVIHLEETEAVMKVVEDFLQC